MRAVRPGVALTLVAIAGCELPFAPGACTTEARPGLRVTVLDSLTGAPLARTALVVASAGAFADTSAAIADAAGDAATAESFTHGLAHERPGVYSVTVERPGYRPWRRDGIRVRAGDCHVRTVDVTARLQQLP